MAEAKRDQNHVTSVLLESSTTPGITITAKGDEVTGRLLVDSTGGATGTVTSVSVVTANGFSGSVANATTTPAITMSTTVIGILKGNGTAISAATAGTDYLVPTTALTAGSILFGGASGQVSQDNTNIFYDSTNHRQGLQTTAPTHSLTFGSTSTGISLYNTVDQTTNYDRVRMAFSSNVFQILSENGGTGAVRNIQFGNANGTLTVMNAGSSNGRFQLASGNSTTANAATTVETAQFTTTSGINVVHSVNATLNQSSSAGYTLYYGNATETSLGSGVNALLDLQVGGVDRFLVQNTGLTTIRTPADSASIQALSFIGARATPTSNDEIYASWTMNNSVSAPKEFARLSARANTITSGSEEGQMNLSVMKTGTLTSVLQMRSTDLTPFTNDGIALGTTARQWSDLFLASGAVINFSNGDYTIVHSTGFLTALKDFRITTVGTNNDSVATLNSSSTFTNKRITPRVTSISSSATPTVNTDQTDAVTITALAVAITSMTTNLSGTPTDFQKLTYRIKDNGTARAITWGASFVPDGVALPTTTVISKDLTVGFLYNATKAAWGCVAALNEA